MFKYRIIPLLVATLGLSSCSLFMPNSDSSETSSVSKSEYESSETIKSESSEQSSKENQSKEEESKYENRGITFDPSTYTSPTYRLGFFDYPIRVTIMLKTDDGTPLKYPEEITVTRKDSAVQIYYSIGDFDSEEKGYPVLFLFQGSGNFTFEAQYFNSKARVFINIIIY